MIRARFLVPLFALSLLVPFAIAQDKPAATTGTISGKVTTADGKAAANVTVRVMAPEAAAATGEKKPENQAKGAKGAKAGKHAPPVAQGTTDQDGNYKIENVPAGDYNVVAAAKGVGMGHAKVSVKAGETATVDITLKAMKPKA